MSDKYIGLDSFGELTQVEAINTSAGAGSAGKIPALDVSGKLSNTMMPAGIGADTKSILASETLAAGDFVNIYNNAGTANVRKADRSNNRRAHGFVLAGVTSGATATVYMDGSNTGVTGKTAGAIQFLSTSGAATETLPTVGMVQQIGVAASATDVKFDNHLPIKLV